MFKLLRHFSLTSAVAILAVTVVLVILYRHNAMDDLVDIAERQNVALARYQYHLAAILSLCRLGPGARWGRPAGAPGNAANP